MAVTALNAIPSIGPMMFPFQPISIHSETSFLTYSFGMLLDFGSRAVHLDGKDFAVMRWMGPSKQFIEKWKRASAHVFFHAGPHIFYLAGPRVASRLGAPLKLPSVRLPSMLSAGKMNARRGEQRCRSLLRELGDEVGDWAPQAVE